MGLGDAADHIDDGGGGKASAASVSCSICLDSVTDNGDRSWAKLQCGHRFHLDCIGSAFNVKGAMQCPNCRKIEKGQWLYANGNRPLPELSMDDWAHDDDLYDLSYSEMSFGVHWCPFNGLTRLPSSFDEGEFSPTAYRDLIGHHAVFAEHTPVSSASHPCPYIAYFGPIHPSSSASSVSVSGGSGFSSHWTGPSLPSEVSNSYGFPTLDLHYHSWDHSTPLATSNRVGAADQSIQSVTQRAARNNSDVLRPALHPFILSHSSSSRAPNSVTSPVLPRHSGGVARPHERSSLQNHFQQPANNPMARSSGLASRRRSSNLRGLGLAQVVPPASSSEQSNGFHLFSSSSSAGRLFQEPENPLHERYNSWEREHQPSFPTGQMDRDSIWGPLTFHPTPAAASSDAGGRLGGFRQRQQHGSERMPPQNR